MLQFVTVEDIGGPQWRRSGGLRRYVHGVIAARELDVSAVVPQRLAAETPMSAPLWPSWVTSRNDAAAVGCGETTEPFLKWVTLYPPQWCRSPGPRRCCTKAT